MAKAFKEWLPVLFDGLDIYLSSSMNKGVPWLAVLDENLKKANFAILCVTRENRAAPWLMYEAGVLSQTAGINHVAPFLLDISASELQSPVTRSQLTVFEREDLETLILSVNQCRAKKERVPESILKKRFNLTYGGALKPLLQEALDFQDEDETEDMARKTLAGVEQLLDISKSYFFDMKKHRQ
ncbi:MAG: hypothetical protein IJK52_10080 [Oscillospiraceae bacterium]|nr:hypothetical protein [Oscillospiraceae bacterium]